MFRSAQFVKTSCVLGTHRSLFGTLNNFKKKNLGETTFNSLFCQTVCMISSKKGSHRKPYYISEPNNSKYILGNPYKHPRSCLINTYCTIDPAGATDFLSMCKPLRSYTTLSDHFILRDCVRNKGPLLENNTSTQGLFVDKWRSELIGSSKSHRSYYCTGSTSYTKSYALSKGLWSSYQDRWHHNGTVKSQTCGLHRRVPQHTALDHCLSVSNEERCRRHLQSNTTLFERGRGKSWAAVLVSLCTVGGEPAFLFTLRSSKLKGKHKGDVSFAGGKQDPSDGNIVETALREAREELGITVTENEVWGLLKPLNDLSGMMIAPVLANLGPLETLSLRPNPEEVEEIFTLTVAHLCNPQNQGYTHFRTGNRYAYTLPVFHSEKYRIWGLTAIALDNTLKLIMSE
ncbi:Nucleoside diphosphate-linked moiety X motif 8 [Bagarius yarrelli]|uniref:Nucleoside diphosphate-linked moiety X motif 8 n=1 Tax=Bagarius yarrelli TaxID=175774 RepID=A0A556U7B8_BAGYA|nr:Nucleoside diphosphate-linked moiety X motif 8 [Bagarius yarrelli]